MAEAFLYDIGRTVLGKLTSLALQQFFLARGLQSEIDEIKNTMFAINAVLLDAEQRQSQSHAIQVWLTELKDVLYDTEDAADEFEYEARRRQVVAESAGKVRRFFSTSNPLVFRFRMAHTVKNIKQRLNRIADLKASLGLNERVNDLPNLIHRERAMTHSFVRKEDVIGRENDKENIVNMLLKLNHGENVSIISIVGIGGLGKTTLAKLVYNDEQVVNHFERKMWVCVSEEFDLQKLVIQILESLGVERNKYVDMQIDQLQKVLRETLDKRRYLLILDDVWNEDSRKWLELKELLLGGSNGSRIIITTRSNRVALIMGTMSTYNLHDLSHNHCLALFFKYVVKEGEGTLNLELVKIGEEIVKKCKGVPLAVITLATLLNPSTDKHEWESIRDSEIWRLEQREKDILPALKLSYMHLSPHLKRCFAYCSIFPKDYIFDDTELVYLWIANGLIQSSSANQEMEEVGFRYFKELSFRCFFQDIQHFGFRFSFKMHDLIHDLAISLTQNEISAIISNDQDIPGSVRHLSFPYPETLPNHLPKSLQNLYHVRTISFRTGRSKGINNVKQFMETCLSRCHYLRFLELSFSKIDILPRSIGNLKHLRYLSLLMNDSIKRLPNSICKLQNLQVLNLGGCNELEELPRDIKDLINLRCLLISTKQKHLPEGGVGCLKSLRSLYISQCYNLEHLFEDIQGLTKLKRLSIFHCNRLISLPESIKRLTSLDTVNITWCSALDLNMDEPENNQHLTQFGLQKLEIAGLPKLEKFPEWLLRGSNNSLQFLTIKECHSLREVPQWVKDIPTLKKLLVKYCPLVENSGENTTS